MRADRISAQRRKLNYLVSKFERENTRPSCGFAVTLKQIIESEDSRSIFVQLRANFDFLATSATEKVLCGFIGPRGGFRSVKL